MTQGPRRHRSAEAFRLLGAAVIGLALGCGGARAEAIDGGRYGPVELSVPDGDVRGYVVLFGDPAGPRGNAREDIADLTKAGALVVQVDTRAYLANLRRDAKPCDQLVGDAEALSRQLQRLHPAPDYRFPILAGTGQGGTLAYATLAQAPNNTLSGVVALDPAPVLADAPVLCPGAEVSPDPGGSSYGFKADLQGFWSVAVDAAADPASLAQIADLRRRGMAVSVETLGPDAGTGTLARLVAPHLNPATSGGVAALPLVELPADKPSRLMAVVMSGDGGWRDIDKTIAEALRQQGVSVVGWDSLRYFWRRKTAEQTAADLAAVLATYGARWQADRIALIGYSFGADVMPAAYDLLPDALRHRVAQVSLLGLEAGADWEITVSGWLGEPPSASSTPVAPAIARMPAGLIQCFYGAEESESACPSLPPDRVELIRTTGGHHFGHDYKGLTETILNGFRRRAGP